MPASIKAKIRREAQQYLEDGEHVLATSIAEPRGAAMSGYPSISAADKMRQVAKAAEMAGLPIPRYMGLVLTDRRLVVLSITRPILVWPISKGGNVKALVSTVAVDEVDSIKVRRLRAGVLAGRVLIVTVHGVPIKLEVGLGAYDKAMVKEFERVKALG